MEGLVRAIRWTDAFWIASGVPALVVFSVGFLAVLDGPISVFIWTGSVLVGLCLAFGYAELAGMFPDKSGGPPVFAAQVWRRYNPAIAALNVWAYWFGWVAVQATGALLIGDYVRRQWAPGQTWSLGWDATSILRVHVDFAYIVGAAIVAGVVWTSRFGIRHSAWTQRLLGVGALVPLALLIVVPLAQGRVQPAELRPLELPGSSWFSWHSFALVCGGLFVAGWSAYGLETAVSYTAEFREPQSDVPRGVFASGAVCLFFYGLGPLVLYTVVGGRRIAEDPSTALVPLSEAVFGAAGDLLIALLLVALLLSVNTAVLGCARTLYQASRDGWTFRFLGRINRHGVPGRAAAFGLAFDLGLMLLGDVRTIIAAAAVGYLLFHTLNPIAAWLMRKDAPGRARPYRAPALMMWLSIVFAAGNLVVLFAGAPMWGWQPLMLGWAILLAGQIAFAYRRSRDGGRRGARRSRLRSMTVCMTAAGATLTLAAWQGWPPAWVAGVVLAVGWALGFTLARDRRWYLW